MRRLQKPLSHLLLLSLNLSPLLTPLSSAPAYAEASTATTALQGVKSALDTTNTYVSSIQYSQAQMQSLLGQFTNLNGQQAALQGGMGIFEQTKADLATALATGQTCMLEAENKKNGRVGKYKKATIASATALLSVEPTCSTYGNVIDSARKILDGLTAAQQKAACLRQLQNSLGQIAEKSKTGFNQLAQAAEEVWNTHDNIITTHKNIAERINKDMNGEGGYKAQLGKLKELSAELYQQINAGMQFKKEGAEGGGFAARLRQARSSRTQAANQWYQTFMGEVQQCFNSSPLECRNGVANSPLGCIADSLGQGAGNVGGHASKISGVAKAQAAANMENLQRTLMLNTAALNDAGRKAALDVKNEAQFLSYTNQQFDKLVNKVVGNFRGQRFYGNVDKSALGNFIKSKYQECYNNASANFKSDMAGDGTTYKAALRGAEEVEAGLNAEIKGLIDRAQSQMNEFRTSFHKVYNAELPQFSQDCTGSDSPYESLDCLRMLSATLKSGIEGTAQTVKLENALAGSGLKQYASNPPTSVLTLQTLTLDQQGRPTMGTSNTTCVGFNECNNVLERYQTSHNDQATAQEETRKKFVQDNNKTVQTAMSGVAAQFTEVSKLFMTEVEKLNKDLAAAGVTSALKTKNVEGEKLEADEKTGLFKTPKDMKAALAGQGVLTELDSTTETESAMRDQANEINAKVKDAFTTKGKCAVKKSDYDAVASAFNSCEEEKVCQGDRVGRMLRSMERLMRKSQAKPDGDDKDTLSKDYLACVKGAKANKNTSSTSDASSTLAINSTTDATERARLATRALEQQAKREEEQRKERADEIESCGASAVDDLDALAKDSRDSLRDKNSKITEGAKRVATACPEDKAEAAAACRDIKSAASNFTPPDDGETKLDDSGAGGGGFTNPLSKGAQ